MMNLQKIITIILLFLFTAPSSFAYTQEEADAGRYLAGMGFIKEQATLEDYNFGSFITRKEVLKTIGKMSGKEIEDKCEGKFSDVKKDDWGCKYIEFALREGLVAKNNNFRPEDLITKTEAIKLILKVKGVEKTRITSNWQEDYMVTAFEKGIIKNKYTDFDTNATRGWIFIIATSVVMQEKKQGIYSDKVL